MSTPIQMWVIEDDLASRESIIMLLAECFPDMDLKGFEYAQDASGATGAPDIILLDVGAASRGVETSSTSATMAIRRLIELHPGATFGIFSGIRHWAIDTVAAIREENPDMIARYVDLQDLIQFVEGSTDG